MISSFELVNLTTKEVATFGQRDGYQYLFKDGGIDWGSVSVQHNTYSHPGQIGESISSTEVGSRNITIEGYCYYIPKRYEVIGLSHNQRVALITEKIGKKKTAISKIINPSDTIKMVTGDYYITGKPSSNVVFGKVEEDNNEYFCKFLIYLFCGNPTFATTVPLTSSLRLSKPGFRFPLIFPKGVGYVFGTLYASSVILVDNFGTISVGCIITLSFKGTVTNVTLNNITTGEKITLAKTFANGEKVVINTNDSDERGVVGYVDGEQGNYFTYWDYQNSWFSLPVGTSTIGYEVGEGSRDNIDVEISISPSKYELEEM